MNSCIAAPPEVSPEITAVVADEHAALVARLQDRNTRIEHLRAVLEMFEQQANRDEEQLRELEGLLGISAQLRIDDLNRRLRGQRLQEVAVEILSREVGTGRSVHYREWFELVRAAGYGVAGKDPLATFLSQVTRAPEIESAGRRSGRYVLRAA